MKFDTIKANATRIFLEGMDIAQRAPAASTPEAFQAVLAFIQAGQLEREELRVFANAFNAKHADYVAQKAKLGNGWSQVVLRAREAGRDLIDHWDVRRVGKLIEL